MVGAAIGGAGGSGESAVGADGGALMSTGGDGERGWVMIGD